ncbi:MAG: hypothetical protein AAGA81_21460, partial [Acidobacteriota bacterium]
AVALLAAACLWVTALHSFEHEHEDCETHEDCPACHLPAGATATEAAHDIASLRVRHEVRRAPAPRSSTTGHDSISIIRGPPKRG